MPWVGFVPRSPARCRRHYAPPGADTRARSLTVPLSQASMAVSQAGLLGSQGATCVCCGGSPGRLDPGGGDAVPFREDLLCQPRRGRPRRPGPPLMMATRAIELPLQELGRYYLKALSADQFARQDTELGVGEPVVIIGYPLGFFDEIHSLPVARQGAIASVYPVPFRGNPFFLVDANLHPGTSGSPVISRPAGTRLTERGVVIGAQSFYLVGVNSGAFGDLNLNAVWFPSVVDQLIR